MHTKHTNIFVRLEKHLFEGTDIVMLHGLQYLDLPGEIRLVAFSRSMIRSIPVVGIVRAPVVDNFGCKPLTRRTVHDAKNGGKRAFSQLGIDVVVSVEPLGGLAACEVPEYEA